MPQPSKPGILASIRSRYAVYRQTRDQLFERRPGDRSLTGPLPVAPEARDEWQFCLLSVAAYGRSAPTVNALPAGMGLIRTTSQMLTRTPKPAAPPNVDDELHRLGWVRWADFPDPVLEQDMRESHLRAEVWEHVGQSKVVAAFGGTVFTSGKDWRSNLRWFLPRHNDEYTHIVKRFAPDFVSQFATRMASPATSYLHSVQICATGHSLGGGLAQQFAYAMPRKPEIQKVTLVYAFDPSPVTGFLSVDKATRDVNKKGLAIVRSYERGEVLALLRSFTSLLVRPSASNPMIRGVRFNLFEARDAIAGHSIEELATQMRIAAGVD